MELRSYLQIARRYWRTLAVVPLVAGLVALAVTFAVSPRYQGITTVQLIPEAVEPRTMTLRSQDGPPSVAIGLANPTELLAQGVIENLGSRPVAEAIVDELQLDQLPQPTGFDALKSQVRGALSDLMTLARYGYVVKQDRRDAMVGAVDQALVAELVRGSYYMRITTTWSDPEIAAAVSNAAVRALTEHTRRVAGEAAAEQSQFLEQQMAEARERAARAREAIAAYSRQSGVVGGETMRLSVSALDRAREAQRANEIAILDAERQLEEARRQLEATPASVTSSTAEQVRSQPQTITVESVGQNPLAVSLHEEMNALEREVAGLENRVGMSVNELRAADEADLAEAQRRLQVAEQQLKTRMSDLLSDQIRDRALALRQDIAGIEARRALGESELRAANETALSVARRQLEIVRQQLSGVSSQIVSSDRTSAGSGDLSSTIESSSPNAVYQALQGRALNLEQEVAALEARRPALQAAVADREREVRALTASDSRLAALADELELASSLYSRRTAQWYDALQEQSRPISQVRVVDAAQPPLYPTQPVKILWVAIAAAAGLGAAIVLVFVRHTTDLSLRTAREAEDVLKLDLLTVVPAPRGGHAIGRAGDSEWRN